MDAVTSRHLLIFKEDDGKCFLNVGIGKINGQWRVTGIKRLLVTEYAGWIAFLKSQGHEIHIGNLDRSQQYGVPVIAVKPGSTFVEAVEGAAWFWNIKRTELIDKI